LLLDTTADHDVEALKIMLDEQMRIITQLNQNIYEKVWCFQGIVNDYSQDSKIKHINVQNNELMSRIVAEKTQNLLTLIAEKVGFDDLPGLMRQDSRISAYEVLGKKKYKKEIDDLLASRADLVKALTEQHTLKSRVSEDAEEMQAVRLSRQVGGFMACIVDL
jgi:hypothetical protein